MKTTIQTSTLVILLICCFSANAQMSVGLRFGLPTGITLKAFVAEDQAFEAYLGTQSGYDYYDDYYYYDYFGYRATIIGAGYHFHKDLNLGDLDIENMQFYFGVGGAVMFFKARRHFMYFDNVNRKTIALQGYLGLWYELENIPVNISLDIMPTIGFGGYDSGFSLGYGALGVRYMLNNE